MYDCDDDDDDDDELWLGAYDRAGGSKYLGVYEGGAFWRGYFNGTEAALFWCWDGPSLFFFTFIYATYLLFPLFAVTGESIDQ